MVHLAFMRLGLLTCLFAVSLMGCPTSPGPGGTGGGSAGGGSAGGGSAGGGSAGGGSAGGSPDGGPPGREWHVSPNGTPSGKGTLAEPWDLATAFAGPAELQPGDTVWLHDGTYPGPVVSSLTGQPGRRITVRQAPNERAIIADNRKQANGATVQVNGAWTTYWGFEVTNTNTDRVVPVGSMPRFRPMGLQVQGPNVQLVNLVIHDTGIAVGFWKEAPDSELYGCLIYNNGSQNTPTELSAGHGVYTQNDQGQKTLKDNIFINQFGFGVHAYPNPGNLVGFNIEGNVSAETGVLSDPAWRVNALLVGPYGSYPADRVTVVDNLTYHSVSTAPVAKGVFANSCFNCVDFGTAGTLEVKNNYLVGGFVVFALASWRDLAVEGNTVVGSSFLTTVQSHPSPTRNVWANNRYFGGPAQPFGFNGSARDFSGWKTALGSDATSTHQASLPTGAKTFLRRNTFDPKRAHLVIYNWDDAATVEVDVAPFLAAGERFELRNAADYFGAPVATGTLSTTRLSVPMTGHTVAAPLGWPAAPSTAPRFGAFVLLRL